jgi:hypothetical protein
MPRLNFEFTVQGPFISLHSLALPIGPHLGSRDRWLVFNQCCGAFCGVHGLACSVAHMSVYRDVIEIMPSHGFDPDLA